MVTLSNTTKYYGVSTDDKPEEAEVNAIFTELDTNKNYYFDGEEWQEIGGSGE